MISIVLSAIHELLSAISTVLSAIHELLSAIFTVLSAIHELLSAIFTVLSAIHELPSMQKIRSLSVEEPQPLLNAKASAEARLARFLTEV
ncbi:hypothetical protein ACIQ1H_14145 [Lysinibacillus sp. NPDC097279]|uniref:hypothetical protein n=1 Tax=Lysinibacillus sp. NPDC097279 TaxID=3364143 RepID=UPI0037F5B1B4